MLAAPAADSYVVYAAPGNAGKTLKTKCGKHLFALASVQVNVVPPMKCTNTTTQLYRVEFLFIYLFILWLIRVNLRYL